MWIDSHTHIFDSSFDKDIQEILLRASQEDIEKMILPGINTTSIARMQQLCRMYHSQLRMAVGLHPTEVTAHYAEQIAEIRKQAEEASYQDIVAIGEVGMDLYWDRTFVEEQKRALSAQIEWALEQNLPLILHVRDAFKETFEVLETYRKHPRLRGVFHSFTSNEADLRIILDRLPRFLIGINGIVTFKKASIRDLVSEIPWDRLLIETDAPYLAPTPFRGKRNEPSMIPYVGKEIALLRGCSVEEVARATTQNAFRLFTLEQEPAQPF